MSRPEAPTRQPSASPAGSVAARHQPSRPTWRCSACAADWPCPKGRRELVRDHPAGRTGLALAMARELGTAITDRPDIPIATLYQRFLGWVRDTGVP